MGAFRGLRVRISFALCFSPRLHVAVDRSLGKRSNTENFPDSNPYATRIPKTWTLRLSGGLSGAWPSSAALQGSQEYGPYHIIIHAGAVQPGKAKLRKVKSTANPANCLTKHLPGYGRPHAGLNRFSFNKKVVKVKTAVRVDGPLKIGRCEYLRDHCEGLLCALTDAEALLATQQAESKNREVGMRKDASKGDRSTGLDAAASAVANALLEIVPFKDPRSIQEHRACAYDAAGTGRRS
ncbi:unnamed protein product [Symbiodinium microadriaticum]|nr:unnamed protein product [Symbiodinium microadriaticum]